MQLLTLTNAQGGCWYLPGVSPGTQQAWCEGVWGVRGYLKTLAWYKKDKTPVGRNRVSGNEEGNERADREKHVHREGMERAAGVGEILLRGRLRCFNPWMAAEPSGEGVGRRLSLSICLPE